MGVKMAIISDYDLEYLKNEVEQIVLIDLERQLKNYPKHICTCKECILDMIAFALNSIRPLYRVTLMGRIYTSKAMDDKAYAGNISDAVLRAIELISKNPSHPPQEEEEKEEE
jgi:competence protein ComFB